MDHFSVLVLGVLIVVCTMIILVALYGFTSCIVDYAQKSRKEILKHVASTEAYLIKHTNFQSRTTQEMLTLLDHDVIALASDIREETVSTDKLHDEVRRMYRRGKPRNRKTPKPKSA